MKETGFNLLRKTNAFNFLKWGEYMKRAQIAERKLEKLKKLVLLVDPAVSHLEVSSTSVTQWNEFIKAFPDEGTVNPPTT